MISKEKLEEIIKNKGVVWVYSTYSKPYRILPITFNGEREINPHAFCLNWNVKNIFETKEDAEFYAEFSCIERTERLELPTWEEFSKWDKSIKFYNNSTKYSMYVFVKNKNTKNCRIIIYADNGEQDWFVFEQPLTQENYLKACCKCKELFLGGSDGDIR